MGTETLDGRERAELCDVLDELGPDAPTLCEGWKTADLAAHIYIREHETLRAGPGAIVGNRVPRLAKITADRMEKAKAMGFPQLVDEIRQGPPPLWRIPGIGSAANLIEFFVHHEDVRRANGREPRTDRPELDDKLWTRLKPVAKLQLLRFRPYGVELVWPGNATYRPRKGDPTVIATGSPQELVLYLYGRKSVAKVELTGDKAAVEAFAAKRFGI